MKLPQEPGLPAPQGDEYLRRLVTRLTDLFRWVHSSIALLTSDVATLNATVAALPTRLYTPTLTNTTNVAASTPYEAQYLRVGNVVHVGGALDIDPISTATNTVLGISLPVASDFAQTWQCGGTAVAGGVSTAECGQIAADVTNNRATLTVHVVTAVNHTLFYTFTYRVI